MLIRPSFRATVVAFLVLTLCIAAAAEEQFKSFHKIPAEDAR